MSSVWNVRRSTTDAKVSGVCGGVARQWGVDPVLVRVGWALLALSGGIGLVLYVAGWLLLPKEGQDDPAIFDALGPAARQWSREVWLVLVGIGCLVTFALLAPLTPFGVGPAVILALVWYFGYYKHHPDQHGSDQHRASPRGRAGNSASTPAQPPAGLPAASAPPTYVPPLLDTPFASAAHAWRQRISEVHGVAPDPSATSLLRPGDEGYEPVGPAHSLPPAALPPAPLPPAPLEPAQPWSVPTYPQSAPGPAGANNRLQRGLTPLLPRVTRTVPRSARRLRLVALAVLAATMAGLYAADRGGLAVPVAGYFSAALLVLGLTLVAATWLGRARGILPLALLVALATVATTVTGPVARSLGWQSEQRTYTSTSELAPGDHQRLGRLRVDLSRLRVSSDAAYSASVGVGDLEVSVPGDTNVVVNWGFRAGAVLIDNQQVNSGTDLRGSEHLGTRNPNGKTLVLNLSVGQGVVQVQQ